MEKKVFISYSWGDESHQEWVVNLAKRLMNDSVDVVLDRWDLRDGHDTFAFMESMVKATDIFRVLIISDRNYTKKANNRDGGVGTETQIITPEIYSNEKQEKFVPILRERDDSNQPYLPSFLTSRKYIDFSQDESFEISYEMLLRNILEAPTIAKPKLGLNPPSYITNSTVNDSGLNFRLRMVENQLDKNPEKVNIYIDEFINEFKECLWEFEVNHERKSVNDLVDLLKSYRPIREDFIKFFKIVIKGNLKIDVDVIFGFFEDYESYLKPRNTSGSWYSLNYEHFKVIFHELFTYLICLCLINKNYGLLEELVHSRIFFKNSSYRISRGSRYTKLYTHSDLLEAYNTENNLRKISPMGDYLISNLSSEVDKIDFILADLLLHYIGELFGDDDYGDSWFPQTHIYDEKSGCFLFFDKMISKRHFDKVKGIFEVQDEDEFSSLISSYKGTKEGQQRIRYNRGGFDSIPFIFEMIKLDQICSSR